MRAVREGVSPTCALVMLGDAPSSSIPTGLLDAQSMGRYS